MPHFGGDKSSSYAGGVGVETTNSMDLSVHSSTSSNTLEEKKKGADLLLSLAESANTAVSSTITTTTTTKTDVVVSRHEPVTPTSDLSQVTTPKRANGVGNEPLMRMSVHGASNQLYPSPIKTQTSEALVLVTSPISLSKQQTPSSNVSSSSSSLNNDTKGSSNEKECQKRSADLESVNAAPSANKKARIDDNDSPTSALLSLASSTPNKVVSSASSAAAAAETTTSQASSNDSKQQQQEQQAQPGTQTVAPTVVTSVAYHGQPPYQPQPQPPHAPPQQQQHVYPATAPYSAYMRPAPPPAPRGVMSSPYSYRPQHYSAPSPHGPPPPQPPQQPQFYHVMAAVPPQRPGVYAHHPPPAHPHHAHAHHPLPGAPVPHPPPPHHLGGVVVPRSGAPSPVPPGSTTILSPPRPTRRTSPPATEETMLTKHAEAQAEAIKSVSAWQQQEANAGAMPPGTSTARCIPLKNPMQSRCWNENSNQDLVDQKLPDFPRLVNFPDYLAKGQARGGNGRGDKGGAVPEGKRHCVMCGKLRVCSSAVNRNSRTSASAKQLASLQGSASSTNGGSSINSNVAAGTESTVHIIPRQNKGVCTACDVTVWMIVGDPGREDKIASAVNTRGGQPRQPSPHAFSSLEIKWCKGCKNFRPWAAFGEKGLATKCVRCRHRQREKYALQKNESRARQPDRKGASPPASSKKTAARSSAKTKRSSPSSSPRSSIKWEEKKDDDIIAAQGLSNLMKTDYV